MSHGCNNAGMEIKKPTELEQLMERARVCPVPLGELADRAGIHRATLSRWMAGKGNPLHDKLESLRRVLDEVEAAR